MKNFLSLFILIILNNLAYSQPEELFRGRHKISGGTYGHPYTTFDRYNRDLCITLRSQSVGTLQGKFMKY
jgi:hypothetical protein